MMASKQSITTAPVDSALEDVDYGKQKLANVRILYRWIFVSSIDSFRQ